MSITEKILYAAPISFVLFFVVDYFVCRALNRRD